SRLLDGRRKTVEIQAVTRQGSDKIGSRVLQGGMQRIGMLHVFFEEVAVVVSDGDIEPSVRNQPTLIERVFLGMAQGHKQIILCKLRKRQSGHPADRFKRRVA